MGMARTVWHRQRSTTPSPIPGTEAFGGLTEGVLFLGIAFLVGAYIISGGAR